MEIKPLDGLKSSPVASAIGMVASGEIVCQLGEVMQNNSANSLLLVAAGAVAANCGVIALKSAMNVGFVRRTGLIYSKYSPKKEARIARVALGPNAVKDDAGRWMNPDLPEVWTINDITYVKGTLVD